jgi:hypothetical protein
MASRIAGRRHVCFRIASIVMCLATATACGDGKPYVDTSLNEATVTGTVSANGVPATGGSIHFNPSNSGRIVPTRSAEIGPDGKYTIKTYTGDNQVTYGGDVATKNRGVGLRRDFATVEAGENHFDFDVLGAGSKTLNIDYAKKRSGKKR